MGSSAKGSLVGGPVNSIFDVSAIQQAVGQNIEAMMNRYEQLGLGVPDPNVFGGDPATAAAADGSLQFGSPGTAEQKDVASAGFAGQAALGQLQNANINNPAIPGSVAQVAAANQQLQGLANQAQFSAGAGSQSGTPTSA